MLLASMKEEAFMGLRGMNLEESAELVKTKAAILKTQANLAGMLYDLPAVLKEVEDRNTAVDAKMKAFKASQEGGSL